MSERDDGLLAQGHALRAWREGKGLTQTLAAAEVGASQGAWGAWETGRKAPDLHFASAIETLTESAVKAVGWAFPRSSSLVARARQAAAIPEAAPTQDALSDDEATSATVPAASAPALPNTGTE